MSSFSHFPILEQCLKEKEWIIHSGSCESLAQAKRMHYPNVLIRSFHRDGEPNYIYWQSVTSELKSVTEQECVALVRSHLKSESVSYSSIKATIDYDYAYKILRNTEKWKDAPFDELLEQARIDLAEEKAT